jgi:hypothetical protein
VAILEAPTIPTLSWEQVETYVHAEWIPDQSPHHCVVAQTRAGKSHLIRHGILPLVQFDRVLVIDSKGGQDKTWAGCGKLVKSLPSAARMRLTDDRKPMAHWYRLVVPIDRQEGRRVVHDALTRIAAMGDFVVVIDETRHITDAAEPGLGLRGPYENLVLRGGSHGVMVVSGTQAPRWVPSTFYDQAGFAWIGRVTDEQAHKRLMEIGGMTRALLPQVAGIERRKWLLNADGGQFRAFTQAPARGKIASPEPVQP